MRFRQTALTAGLLVPLAAASQPPAFNDVPSQRALAAGEIPVRSTANEGERGGRVNAAVMIHARLETVWQVMHDCENASSYIPGLRRCHRVQGADDGSWEIIEHEVKYSWIMPAIHTVMRLEYRPGAVEFRRISGDLRTEEGTWRVLPTADDRQTLVEYELHVDPGFWVPGAIVRTALRHELPAALEALRKEAERVEHLAPHAVATAHTPGSS